MDSPELIPLLLIYGSETMGYKKKLFLLKDIFQFDTCNFPNVMRLFELNLWDWNNAFSYYCLSWEQCKICKFWIWPLNALEAVAEAIIAWSQLNFQDIWVRYKS